MRMSRKVWGFKLLSPLETAGRVYKLIGEGVGSGDMKRVYRVLRLVSRNEI